MWTVPTPRAKKWTVPHYRTSQPRACRRPCTAVGFVGRWLVVLCLSPLVLLTTFHVRRHRPAFTGYRTSRSAGPGLPPARVWRLLVFERRGCNPTLVGY